MITLEMIIEIPKCGHGIGDLILASDSPKLIGGVKCAPFAIWPDDRGFFLEKWSVLARD